MRARATKLIPPILVLTALLSGGGAAQGVDPDPPPDICETLVANVPAENIPAAGSARATLRR